MDPITIAALVSVVGSLVSGYMNNQSIKKTNQANVDMQNDVNQQNVDNQWKMWNATNQYNSPLEQMKRYKAAGLNPNLIYGQSNTTQAMNIGNSSAITQMPQNFDFLATALPSLIQAMSGVQQVQKGHTEIDMLVTENLIKQMEHGYLSKHYENLLDLDEWQLKKLQKDFEHVEKLIEIGDLDIALKQLEKTSKNLGVAYEQSQFSMGLIPDLDPQIKAIVNIVGNLFHHLSRGKIDKDEFIKSIIGFETPQINN